MHHHHHHHHHGFEHHQGSADASVQDSTVTVPKGCAFSIHAEPARRKVVLSAACSFAGIVGRANKVRPYECSGRQDLTQQCFGQGKMSPPATKPRLL
jgi:hypothetical protein